MKIAVHVKPNSKKGPLVQPDLFGNLLVFVREPAVDGKANRAVVELLADYFKLPKTNITLIRGATTRTKVFEISGIEEV